MIVTVTLNPAIDRILSGDGTLVASIPAGKGVNVSRYLSALGHPSIAAGFVGEGELAQYEQSFSRVPSPPNRGATGGHGWPQVAACKAARRALRTMRSARVRVRGETKRPKGATSIPLITAAFVTIPDTTRTNTTTLSGDGTGETHVREKGFDVPTEAKARLRDSLLGLSSDNGPFVFSGSLPRGFSAADFAELIIELKARGASVIVDTSAGALASAIATGVDMISPNDEELGIPGGNARALVSAARETLRAVGIVAVTRGPEGAILVTHDSAWAARVDTPDIDLVSTVGAGDAFLAGFLAAQTDGESPDACLAQAVAAGSASVLEPRVGELDAGTFEKFLSTIDVREEGIAAD